MKKLCSYVWVFAIIISSCVNAQSANGIKTVNVEAFSTGLNDGKDIQILDVRTMEEFTNGHIAGAMQANVNDNEEFETRVAALDKDKPLYVYCLAGGRSHAAAEALKEKGFSNIIELDGGMNAWKQAKMPVEGMAEGAMMAEGDYEHLTKSAPLVLVDFGAEWCPPCKKMDPRVKAVDEKYEDLKVVKIDGGKEDALMDKYLVEALPTFILYKDGVQVWRGQGLMEQSALEAEIQKHN